VLSQDAFKEALLLQMERKVHWAWPAFTGGLVPKHLLHVHLEQEYAVYVRDFPVLVARAYVQCPIAEVRRELVENIYEEETGGLFAGRPHPELFLEYPRGLGMELSRFEAPTLLPSSQAFRDFLDHATTQRGWCVAAAVTTLFLEGTAYERGELDDSAPKRPAPPLSEHPLVKHYGLPLDALALTKAHRTVEGDHRQAAWRVLLNFTPEDRRAEVVAALAEAVDAWQAYRDGVAHACGLERDERGGARLRADL
jgi:pyrroloquinoline quinone (PQQ) biosynthesis protein C